MALRRKKLLLTLLFLPFFAACTSTKPGPPPIGQAYVGPATLNLRQELAIKSPVVAVVKHGDRLDVLQTRRRFLKVRAENGAIGWTDSRQLLSTDQMNQIRNLTEASAHLPSQGRATVEEALNMHTEPSRTSPSFAQIPENGSVDVIGHKVAPKIAPAVNEPIVAPRPPAPKKTRPKKESSSRIPPPPMPAPPPLPANWLELSRTALPQPGDEEISKGMSGPAERPDNKVDAQEPAKPVPMEDWSFVRMKDGRVGWVLSRMLTMSIPDDVAQYAEGHRITSYFALADVQDGDQMKHVWLWTTMTHNAEPFEFDSFRVFIWSLRRHRYETAYIERNVEGHYPVEAHKGTGDKGEGATFSVILSTDNGQAIRKSYAFNGYRINLTGKEPYQLPREEQPTQIASTAANAPASHTEQKSVSWYLRLKQKVATMLRK